jgi:hypothetical protein
MPVQLVLPSDIHGQVRKLFAHTRWHCPTRLFLKVASSDQSPIAAGDVLPDHSANPMPVMMSPPRVEFDEKLDLLLWRPHGMLGESVVNKIIAYIGEKESQSDRPFNRFTDALKIETFDLNFRYVFHVCLFRRLSSVGRPSVKSAILVPKVAHAHYLKLHAILTQGSPLQVELFEDRAEAAKWLGVPVENLEIDHL